MGADNKTFYSKFKKAEGCWEWTGAKKPSGYGNFFWEGKYWSAHRFSYTLHIGVIPDGDVVCHRCDNPGCVNPAHLFVGTQLKNITDMITKGRGGPATRKGASHLNAKLTDEQVQGIRKQRRAGETLKSIAKDFGVSEATVSLITRGKTWTHLVEEVAC